MFECVDPSWLVKRVSEIALQGGGDRPSGHVVASF